MESINKPIGYLVKQVDVLLTKRIDKIQQAFGLARISWQIIHTISRAGSVATEELTAVMQPFADVGQIQQLLQQLIAENLIDLQAENTCSLTGKGTQLHQQCLEAQKQFRQKVMLNITPQAYETTLRTLQNIIANIS